MEFPLIYALLLLLSSLLFSSGITYNEGNDQTYFSCTDDGLLTDMQTIKLFLDMHNLIVYCYFKDKNKNPSRETLGLFTSGGLAPTMIILNSTFYGSYNFKLSPLTDQIQWVINIPRENITVNTDIAAIEQWIIRITMHDGLNIYDTEGTLLDLVREPILQWDLGIQLSENEIKDIMPNVQDIKVTKSPCANDVALMGLIMKPSTNGVFIGETIYGFWTYEDCIWFELTDVIYAELQDEHKGLTVIDLVLTNHFLIILTSLGLYVSSDLRHATYSRIKVDYVRGKLWYNEKCFANRESFEVDYVTITFNRNRTLSESSSCFFSREPFLEWIPCVYFTYKDTRSIPHVTTFLIDQETDSGIYLFHMQDTKEVFVTVSMLKDGKPSSQPKFPTFKFPSTFSNPVGMVFHPRSHFLYVYGNGIWLSMDGGNTFELMCNLLQHYIRKTAHSFYTADIVFIQDDGKIFSSKAGVRRYNELGQLNDNIFTLYYDQLGYIHKLTPYAFDSGSNVLGHEYSRSIFGKAPDLGFETALAPQYISPREMILFSYMPENTPKDLMPQKKFSQIHLGKTIDLSKGGSVYIKDVFSHDKKPVGFYSSVVTEIIQPFGMEDTKESPCLLSDLQITYSGNTFYTLSLLSKDANHTFRSTDVEKTVLVLGHSSFLIVEIKDEWTASALATMPQTVKSTLNFTEGTWFLYSFGTVGGRIWTIGLKPCDFLIHTDSIDFESLSIVKYIDVGNQVQFTLHFHPNSIGLKAFPISPVTVMLGNPALLDVKTRGYYDIHLNYILTININGKFFQKGFTTLALILWGGSTDCFATTIVANIKSSCSYLRTMHHIPDRNIPPEDWIKGVHKDSQGFNLIKTLPINYRPPSNMGISIPLTDNFYHADPSKPIPRNQFHKSKETGKYKQCANATSREMCNCSEYQKTSHAVAFSDCKEKVHRFKFPVTRYPVVLKIFNEREKVSVEPPYLVTMTEVNKRKNWQLRHNEPENIKKMKDFLESRLQTPVYNPLGLNLTIKGSELFHFKVSVVPGVSFCDLEEEFQIYVDEVPLPFPGHALIAVATSVVLGGLIFIAFVFQLRNIHPMRALKNFLRETTAQTSTITVNS